MEYASVRAKQRRRTTEFLTNRRNPTHKSSTSHAPPQKQLNQAAKKP